jgi:hypothetical protein
LRTAETEAIGHFTHYGAVTSQSPALPSTLLAGQHLEVGRAGRFFHLGTGLWLMYLVALNFIPR